MIYAPTFPPPLPPCTNLSNEVVFSSAVFSCDENCAAVGGGGGGGGVDYRQTTKREKFFLPRLATLCAPIFGTMFVLLLRGKRLKFRHENPERAQMPPCRPLPNSRTYRTYGFNGTIDKTYQVRQERKLFRTFSLILPMISLMKNLPPTFHSLAYENGFPPLSSPPK